MKYVSDWWNIFDQVMYIILVVAIILRYKLPEDDFTWARNVYAVDLVMFYLRVLELFLIHQHLGPIIVMIGKMVRALF